MVSLPQGTGTPGGVETTLNIIFSLRCSRCKAYYRSDFVLACSQLCRYINLQSSSPMILREIEDRHQLLSAKSLETHNPESSEDYWPSHRYVQISIVCDRLRSTRCPPCPPQTLLLSSWPASSRPTITMRYATASRTSVYER